MNLTRCICNIDGTGHVLSIYSTAFKMQEVHFALVSLKSSVQVVKWDCTKLRLNSVLFSLSVSEMVGRKRKTEHILHTKLQYIYTVCIIIYTHTYLSIRLKKKKKEEKKKRDIYHTCCSSMNKKWCYFEQIWPLCCPVTRTSTTQLLKISCKPARKPIPVENSPSRATNQT